MGSTVKRHKRRIFVSIVALSDEVELAKGAVDNARRYADETYVVQMGRSDPTPEFQELHATVGAVAISPDYASGRGQAYRWMWPSHRYINGPDNVTMLFMEVGWRIPDTDSVRNAIEYHPENVLTAVRRFQWDDDHYRVDGLFRPGRLPIAARARQGLSWTSGLRTAPDWMWEATTEWVEAPFDVVDVTFMDETYRWGDDEPKLEPIPGRVFV